MDKKKRKKAANSDCTLKVTSDQSNGKKGQKWEKPTLEDVSGRVMAQPYIRFT